MTTTPITQYEVYRRVEGAESALSRAAPEGAVRETMLQEARDAGMQSDGSILAEGWDYVGAVPAHGTSQYSIVVPLLPEVPSPSGYQAFLVRAATATPTVFFDSCIDTIPQVDSLPPSPPTNFRATSVSPGGDVQLAWDPVAEPDVRRYRLYRGGGPAFPIASTSLIAMVTSPGYLDPGAAPGGSAQFYKLIAEDFVGNSADFSLASTGTLDVPGGAAASLHEFLELAPNPSRGEQVVKFGLPKAGRVSLAIFDVSGRLVRRPLRDTAFDAGAHEWRWDGRDALGRTVAPGVYMVRFTVGESGLTRRMLRME